MITSNIKDIQKVQLYIMDHIHDLCVKHNLRYYLIGGSALGAVRHGGFIPWDVDIDIAMPRDDYNKFYTIAKTELNTNLSAISYIDNKYLLSPHIIVVLNNSKITFSKDKLNPQIKREGIYVDVLPLDKVPLDESLRIKQKKRLLRLRELMELRMLSYYETDSWIRKIIKSMLIHTIYRIPTSIITKEQNRISQWGNDQDNYHELCSMLSHYSYDKLCMPKEWFGSPSQLSFEGREYFVPSAVKSYLQKLFGDFMKLPSIEEQKKYESLIDSAEFEIKI